ncbi:MAG: hypothetical protein Fur0046_24200 [Cyanobacteria bacterium J069]
MRRAFLSLVVSLILGLNLFLGNAAHAFSLSQFSLSDLLKAFPGLTQANDLDLTEAQKELLAQLNEEVLPQIAAVLRPDQIDKFAAEIASGDSLRKAFKTLTLTPEQKTELAGLIKGLPKSDFFATLTPEQRTEFFMRKKGLFMPTLEEITEKIKFGLKKKEMFAPTAEEIAEKVKAKGIAPDADGTVPTVEEIAEKIKIGLKKKEEFAPSLETITEKIKQKIESISE